MPSKIEWTDETWNPVTGCTKVSAGCKNCYAERLATGRLKHLYPDGFGKVTTHPDRLDQPLRWKRPRRIFVCSMSDLFHEDVPTGFIYDIFAVMKRAPQHTFQVLTKRPERMGRYIKSRWPTPAFENLHPNVWLGVSVEDQATADERIPLLLDTPAAVRFVSYEPALGPVEWLHKIQGLDWLIAGGESGPGARPSHPDWYRMARAACAAAGIAFMFKQWGEYAPPEDLSPVAQNKAFECKRALVNFEGDHRPGPDTGTRQGFMWRVGKKAAGRLLDGREWSEFPEVKP